MRKFFSSLIKRIRKFISWLWEQEGSPSQRSLGFGLGIFSGCFPFFGLQTIMGVFLAKIFNGNTILAALGTWISNPFTYIPLYYFNFRIGTFLLSTDTSIVDVSHITTNELWTQGWYLSSRLLIGSTFVGFITGTLGGLCSYFLLKNLLK